MSNNVPAPTYPYELHARLAKCKRTPEIEDALEALEGYRKLFELHREAEYELARLRRENDLLRQENMFLLKQISGSE